LDLHSSAPLESHFGDDDAVWPALFMLEKLRELGWVGRPGVVHHTRASRQLSHDQVQTRTPYVRVLLRWEALPHIANMRSDQVKGYYECLLLGLAVPEGQRAAYYARVLLAGEVLPLDDMDRGSDIVQERRRRARAPWRTPI